MYLDFAEDGAAAGGYVQYDGQSFRAAVVGYGRHPLIALRDDELPRRKFDIRTEGLWASVTCETPDEHWSVGMEAFAVGYDDPAEAVGDERGDRVALGFDLEWERDGKLPLWRVTGELLVDDARLAVDTRGWMGTALVSGRVGTTPFVTDDLIPVVGPDGLLAGGVASAGDLRAQLEPRWPAPMKSTPGVPRALCTLSTADGPGVAWAGAV